MPGRVKDSLMLMGGGVLLAAAAVPLVAGVASMLLAVGLLAAGRRLCDLAMVRQRSVCPEDDEVADPLEDSMRRHPSGAGRDVQAEMWQSYLTRRDVRRGPSLDVWLSRHGRG